MACHNPPMLLTTQQDFEYSSNFQFHSNDLIKSKHQEIISKSARMSKNNLLKYCYGSLHVLSVCCICGGVCSTLKFTPVITRLLTENHRFVMNKQQVRISL